MTTFDTKRILFEDEHFIAVKKHSGELVVADRWQIEKDILLHNLGDYLRSQGHQKDKSGRDLYPVHRLDRDTSGVVLFAKNQDVHRALSIMFEGREMDKTYWTFCVGNPVWDYCLSEVPLNRAEGKKGRGRALVDLGKGKPSCTEFNVTERFPGVSWLEAKPKTGRLHQIRLHLKVMGHPVLHDPLYSDDQAKERKGRLMLHARSIQFIHPITKVDTLIECPMDEDMRLLLNQLKTAKTEV